MIAIRCRRCDSVNLRKNGHTPSGQQKFHCKDCNAYGTLDTKEQERAHKQAPVEKLHLERLSQRAIARTQAATSEAVETLREVMNDKSAKGSERIAAAKAILDYAMKGIELEDHEQRLEELEAKLAAAGQRR